MKITINENYFIKADTYNLSLIKTYVGKDKDGNDKESQKALGYFRTVEQVIVFMAREQLLNSHEELTIAEYIKALNQTIQALREVCQI